MPPVTTRIFPSAENPLGLVLELSEKLRFSEPCPLSPSDGFRAAFPLAFGIEGPDLLTVDNSDNLMTRRQDWPQGSHSGGGSPRLRRGGNRRDWFPREPGAEAVDASTNQR
jgi:hypothetical protein